MHEKKAKGDIGVVFVIANLTEQGWNVSLPITEHASYDLIAEKQGICKRVQVRYTTPCNGSLRVKLRSCWSDKNGIHTRLRRTEDFDILAVFNPSSKESYFIDSKDFTNISCLTLRLAETKNNQITGIRMVQEYRKMA